MLTESVYFLKHEKLITRGIERLLFAHELYSPRWQFQYSPRGTCFISFHIPANNSCSTYTAEPWIKPQKYSHFSARRSFFQSFFLSFNVRRLSQRRRTLHYEIGVDLLYFTTQVLNMRWFIHILYSEAFRFAGLERTRFSQCLQKGTCNYRAHWRERGK